jgi:hypothetical protein
VAFVPGKRYSRKQVDAELLGAARRPAERRGEYDELPYVEFRKGSTLYVYGPFASAKEATRANLFRRSADEADAVHRAENMLRGARPEAGRLQAAERAARASVMDEALEPWSLVRRVPLARLAGADWRCGSGRTVRWIAACMS